MSIARRSVHKNTHTFTKRAQSIGETWECMQAVQWSIQIDKKTEMFVDFDSFYYYFSLSLDSRFKHYSSITDINKFVCCIRCLKSTLNFNPYSFFEKCVAFLFQLNAVNVNFHVNERSLTWTKNFISLCCLHLFCMIPVIKFTQNDFWFIMSVLIVSLQLNGEQNATTRAANVGRYKYDREKKLGHRRVGDGGEITYKKIQSSHIMGSIQLGIQHTVSIRLYHSFCPWIWR